MRRFGSRVAAALIATMGVLAADAGAELPGQPLSPVAQQVSKATKATKASSGETEYRGSLKITVAYYGYDCQFRDLDLHLQGTRTYRMPVSVIRGKRAAYGSIHESSPFNLVISSDLDNEAGMMIESGIVTTDPKDGRSALFEYWKISAKGSRLQGRLVNSWRQAGVALNIFATDRLLVPCQPNLGLLPKTIQTLNEGATLTGTLTGNRAALTIKGQTFDKERRFTALITATR